MKKITLILLVAVLCLSLTACFGSTEIKTYESRAFEKKIVMLDGYTDTTSEDGSVFFKNSNMDSSIRIYRYTDKAGSAFDVINDYIGGISPINTVGFIAPSKEGYTKSSKVYSGGDDKYSIITCYTKTGETYLINIICKVSDYGKYNTEFEKVLKSFEI